MIKRIFRNEDGATVVEFALLIPVIFASFMGVLQAGLSMMTYNSLRNLTAETSRYTLVEYQSSNEISLDQIKTDGKNRAAMHGFVPENLVVDVTQPETQRIEGAIELNITAQYKVTSVMAFLGIDHFDVSFSRPIFLIDEVDNSEDGSELDESVDTGTDFGEGGLDDGTGGDTGAIDEEKQCADPGQCDHDHTAD